jgi:hypothetical protein
MRAVTFQAHREIALVASAERLWQAQFPQRPRSQLGAAGAADRVDRHADRHRRVH